MTSSGLALQQIPFATSYPASLRSATAFEIQAEQAIPSQWATLGVRVEMGTTKSSGPCISILETDNITLKSMINS